MDQLHSSEPIYYAIERDDNYLSIGNAQSYFTGEEGLSEITSTLLKGVNGVVVEFAAGAGRISKILMQYNPSINLLTSDVSDMALDVCHELGISNTKRIDITQYQSWNEDIFDQQVDAFIIFGNSLGVIYSKSKLVGFFNKLYELSSDHGIVLGDFRDPLDTDNQIHLDYQQNNRNNNRAIGLVTFRMRYLQFVGNWMNLWQLTPREFKDVISETSWNVELFGTNIINFKLYKT